MLNVWKIVFLNILYFFLGSLLLESKIQPDTAYQKQQVFSKLFVVFLYA